LLKDVNEAIEYTLGVLPALPDRDTWVIPQSGGKDSRATAQVTLALIRDGRLSPPRRLIFPLADTLLEFERFDVQAKAALQDLSDEATALGIEAHSFVTVPIPQQDFWVRILGYGFVPPTSRMRSCTDLLKITPIRKILRRFGWADAPLLLGVRRGESGRRDEILSCTVGGECGPDHLYLKLKQRASSAQKAVAPILTWGLCAVWDWLRLAAPGYGFDNTALVDLYGPDGDLRYGCWCCPLIFQDRSGAYLAQTDPKMGELVRFGDTVLRRGGAAWQSQNRELFPGANGRLKDGRLSLDFCRRLFDWLLAFEARWDYPLLSDWQKGMIRAIWAWRESLPDVQRGIKGQLPLPFEDIVGVQERALHPEGPVIV
jgi:DNA sulfur modification protein DndC